MLIYCLLGIVYTQLAYVTEVMNQITNQECSARGRLVYGQQKLHQLQGIYFCDNYAKRTCCSQQNLEELKIKWYREQQQSVEISTQCQEILTKTICSDCDGDIGQQIRVGFCPQYCNQLYHACFNDQFQYDEKTQKLRICYQNDLLCSELHNILNNGDQFCNALGYRVNSYYNFDEWIENKYLNLSTQPLCWDGQPSHRLWAQGPKLPQTKAQTKKPKYQEEQSNIKLYGSAIAIIIALIVLILKFYKR